MVQSQSHETQRGSPGLPVHQEKKSSWKVNGRVNLGQEGMLDWSPQAQAECTPQPMIKMGTPLSRFGVPGMQSSILGSSHPNISEESQPEGPYLRQDTNSLLKGSHRGEGPTQSSPKIQQPTRLRTSSEEDISWSLIPACVNV